MKLLDFLLFYQFKHKVSCLFRNHSTKTTLPADQHIKIKYVILILICNPPVYETSRV